MTQAYIGLMSREGDRLGHLVRGVQMLRSYGAEADVLSYSGAVDVSPRPGEEPALCCLLECSSDATLEGLRGICRETEWALGENPRVLTASVVQYDGHTQDDVPECLQGLMENRYDGAPRLEGPDAFAALCDWGQVSEEDQIMGEWPSAVGR